MLSGKVSFAKAITNPLDNWRAEGGLVQAVQVASKLLKIRRMSIEYIEFVQESENQSNTI